VWNRWSEWCGLYLIWLLRHPIDKALISILLLLHVTIILHVGILRFDSAHFLEFVKPVDFKNLGKTLLRSGHALRQFLFLDIEFWLVGTGTGTGDFTSNPNPLLPWLQIWRSLFVLSFSFQGILYPNKIDTIIWRRLMNEPKRWRMVESLDLHLRLIWWQHPIGLSRLPLALHQDD